MARRPTMSSKSFLEWVTHPNKAPRPTGARKSTVKNNPNRKASRVKAYNNLDPLKQKILVESGAREAYLKGEVTLTDARRELVTGDAVTAIISAAAGRNEIDGSGNQKAPINRKRVVKNVAKLTPTQRRRAANVKNYQELIELINSTRDEDGYSPYFYK